MEDIRNSDSYKKKFVKLIFKKHGLENYEDVLNNIYKDNWDININILSRVKFQCEIDIILYFDKITITNGQLSHDIVDLYVRIHLLHSQDILQVYPIKGVRSTVTTTEVSNNYMHSHLSGKGICKEFYKFCLGTGPLSNIKMLDSEDDFIQYLLLINEYLKWESIEGRPYRLISKLNTTVNIRNIGSRTCREILTDFIPNNVSFIFNQYGIGFKINNDLEQQVFEYLKEKYPTEDYYCFKGNDGKYYSKRINKFIAAEYPDIMILKFKGELINYKIIEDETEVEFIPNCPLPSITEHITKELSSKFETYFVNS